MDYGTWRRDTWLECPDCSNNRMFRFISDGVKVIDQDPTTGQRHETSFTIADNPESDWVECCECECFGPYEEFADKETSGRYAHNGDGHHDPQQGLIGYFS